MSARGCQASVMLFALSCASAAYGAATTWTGATDSDWANAANWSAGVPGAADDAVFDGAVDCTVDVVGVTTVGNITLAATYSGTVTQGMGADVCSGILTLNGGTWFTGSNELEVSGAGNTAAMLVIGGGTLDLDGISGTLVYATHTAGTVTINSTPPDGCKFAYRVAADVAATFEQQVSLGAGYLMMGLGASTSGGTLTYNTNDFPIYCWYAIMVEYSNVGTVIVNFGSSVVEAKDRFSATNGTWIINWDNCTMTMGICEMWHTGAGRQTVPGAVSGTGNSTVTITGALVGALESFRAFVREPASQASAPYRQPATDAIGELEQRVGRVTILIEPVDIDGLEVALDGNAVPLAALGRPRLVDPGTHTLSAAAPGYRREESELSVAEGGSELVTITLTLAPSAPAPAPTPDGREPIAAAADEPADVPVLPIVLMGGGAALLGIAIGVGVAGLRQANDAPSSEGDEADGARTKAIVADVLGGTGIVAAAVGLVLLLTGDDDPPSAPGAVGLWSAGSVGGLLLSF